MANFIPFFNKKKKTRLSYISKIFTKNISQNWKKFATKENSGSYPPQSFSNSGIAYPPNERFCFGEIFLDLKNIISTHTKDFPSKKKKAQICPILKKKVSKSPDEWNMNMKPHSMAMGGKSTKQDHALDSTLCWAHVYQTFSKAFVEDGR